jgi:membrane protease YdiL (CAAX protease family)
MSDDISKAPVEKQDTTAQKKVPWGPVSAILVAVATYVGASIVSGLLLDWYASSQHWSTARANDWLSNSILAQFLYVLITEGITIGAVLFFLHTKHAGLRVLGWMRFKIRDLGYAFGGAFVYYALYFVALAILLHITHINADQKQNIGFQNVVGTGQLLMTFASLVALPPLVEETVFRGFLFGGLKTKFPVKIAAVFTSILFAAPHLLEGGGSGPLWVAGVDTFVLSIVLCYLREKTGSLWAGMLVHMLKNGIAFYSLFIVAAR